MTSANFTRSRTVFASPTWTIWISGTLCEYNYAQFASAYADDDLEHGKTMAYSIVYMSVHSHAHHSQSQSFVAYRAGLAQSDEFVIQLQLLFNCAASKFGFVDGGLPLSPTKKAHSLLRDVGSLTSAKGVVPQ